MDNVMGNTTDLNGIAMYYEVQGSGSPLVLLHGFFGSSADWVHLVDRAAIADKNRLIVPDLRGHGRSTNPAGTITHRQCALDVYALLDHLGIKQFRALGTSLGGNTLLHMATQQPDRVEAMVLVGSPSYFPGQARAIMGAVAAETQPEEEWRTMRARHKHGDAQIRALYAQANAFKDSYDDMNFTPPVLSRITARTLIVTGDRDPLYPVEIFVEQYRAIPRSALLVLPEGGHDAIYQEAKGYFVETARRFLGA
jgi:pimeloyl-ACP methyl ester carboxylesterase